MATSNGVRTPQMGRIDLLLYSVGSLGTGIFMTVPSVLLLYFCTELMAIAPLLAGLILFLPKAWALFWDPYVGGWSDRVAARSGRRGIFLAVGAVGTALSFMLLFSPPAAIEGWRAALWLGGAYWLLLSCYALFAVPYMALPPIIAADAADRGRMVGWRLAGAMFGVLLGGGLAPMLVQWGGTGRAGYAVMSLWIGSGCALAMLCPLLALRRIGPAGGGQAPAGGGSYARIVAEAARDGVFRSLLAAYVALLAGAGILSAATPYFITGPLGRSEADIGSALGAMLLVTSLTAPALAWLGRRLNYRAVLKACLLIYLLAAMLIALLIGDGGHWPMLLACFGMAGLAFAGLQVMPFAMLADHIHAICSTNPAREGSMTGLWVAVEKLGLALSPLFVALILTLVGGDMEKMAWPAVAIMAALFLAVFPLLRSAAAHAPEAGGQ